MRVQHWVAIAGIIGGLMSIPALIISINALKLSEEQRADAAAQRAEDQREKAQTKAAEEARTAFSRNLHLWRK
ncbi:hypothetical protein [Nonomuraea sp. NPDC023979]|uniref:hypothetical protein n=1 Tax=Nonomuraea sp. NPDC023979 TaxID=3154796 RepID=UPI0033FA1498